MNTILAVGKIEKGSKIVAPGNFDAAVAINALLEAAMIPDAPPPSRDERAEEAAWQVDRAAAYDWRKAQLEDLIEARADIDFWRSGC